MIQMICILAVVLISRASADVISMCSRADCAEIYANRLGYGLGDGPQPLRVGKGLRDATAYCDMTTDGGGWTVIQRRYTGAQSFYKTWNEYVNGFGSAYGEYWFGLKYLKSILYAKRYVLRIEFTDWNGITHYAEYDDFKVGGAACNYTLERLGVYCGDCGDSLSYHLGMQFSTYDRDNDDDGRNCAVLYKGAWWYKGCHYSNLNGEYKTGGSHDSYADGLEWGTCGGFHYSYKSTKMMIRPYDY